MFYGTKGVLYRCRQLVLRLSGAADNDIEIIVIRRRLRLKV